ncbi:MAG: hypothetical protein ACJ77K_00590 [Bacteroidia bacterium]
MLIRTLHKSILPLIIGIVLLCSSNIQWGGDKWKDIIEADGNGYYAYLPAMFIYHDLHFDFYDSIDKKYSNPHLRYDYRMNADGGTVDKYYVGTAVAMSPFFFIAHACASDADGFSKIYPVMINVAAIFYLLLALIFLRKLLLRLGAADHIISFILVAIVFGTNVFYYAVCEPAMSHIYSFAFITIFLYYLQEFFRSANTKTLLLLSFLLGMIVLIRPVNGLVVLIIPFIAGGKEPLKKAWRWLLQHPVSAGAGFVVLMLMIGIQLVIYKIQTGHFFVYAYGNENFNWSDPHPLDFLFSYKKGLFVYTPLIFLSLYGTLLYFKKNTFQFYSIAFFSIVLLYVLSSWWNWWYGGSFSSRVSLEYYGLAAIMLWTAYEEMRSKISRSIFSGLIVCCIVLCQVQTFQYRYYLIHWEKMDKEHYWRVFMRMDKTGDENPNKDLLSGG